MPKQYASILIDSAFYEQGRHMTLYEILGIEQSATTIQVDAAYRAFQARLKANVAGLSNNEVETQLLAVKEAYATLSNPILRQRYDLKLAGATSAAQPTITVYEPRHAQGSSLAKIALIGTLALAAIYVYSEKAKEREKLRIEHEHQVQMKAAQIAEEKQKQSARIQDQLMERSSANSELQQHRAAVAQYERESAQRQQQELLQRRQELAQQQQEQREEANRRRQEQLAQQQRLQNEKRYLQQLERERYGKVITY